KAMYHRSPAVQAAYEEKKKTYRDGWCPFCDYDNFSDDIILHTNRVWLIRNAFPYENAVEHWMVVPRPHVASFKQLQSDKKLWEDWQRVLQWGIDMAGGNVELIARNNGNEKMSVRGHHHTHLIV